MNFDKKTVSAYAEKMMDRIIDFPSDEWNMNIEKFDWVPGVGLFGIYNGYLLTKNEKYFNFLCSWLSRHIEEAYEGNTVNSTAPLITASFIYEENKNEELLKIIKDAADNILENAPLTEYGGLEHTVTEEGAVFKEQVWADTLFMACIYIAKLFAITKNKKYKDFVVKQIKIHHKYLINPENGLYFHGYNGKTKDHMSSIHWARANGWIIYSISKIIRMWGEFEEKTEFCGYIKKHAAALKKVQQPDGGFCTILNDFSSYEETSATAAIAAGIKIAQKLEVLNSDFDGMYYNALNFILSMTDDNGTVLNVSGGTPVMQNADEYKKIKIEPTLYGQGLSVTALKEGFA